MASSEPAFNIALCSRRTWKKVLGASRPETGLGPSAKQYEAVESEPSIPNRHEVRERRQRMDEDPVEYEALRFLVR